MSDNIHLFRTAPFLLSTTMTRLHGVSDGCLPAASSKRGKGGGGGKEEGDKPTQDELPSPSSRLHEGHELSALSSSVSAGNSSSTSPFRGWAAGGHSPDKPLPAAAVTGHHGSRDGSPTLAASQRRLASFSPRCDGDATETEAAGGDESSKTLVKHPHQQQQGDRDESAAKSPSASPVSPPSSVTTKPAAMGGRFTSFFVTDILGGDQQQQAQTTDSSYQQHHVHRQQSLLSSADGAARHQQLMQQHHHALPPADSSLLLRYGSLVDFRAVGLLNAHHKPGAPHFLCTYATILYFYTIEYSHHKRRCKFCM